MFQTFQCFKCSTHRWGRRGEEDQTTEIGGALVRQCASCVDQSANTVGLNGRANERGTPRSGSRSGLLGLEEFLLGVSRLGLSVDITEQWAEDGERGDVVENGAQCDGRGLDRREV